MTVAFVEEVIDEGCCDANNTETDGIHFPVATISLKIDVASDHTSNSLREWLSYFSSDLWSLEKAIDRLQLTFGETDLPALPAHWSTFDVISAGTGPTLAHSINNTLYDDLNLQQSQIVGFRSWVAYPFTNEDQFWSVLEWREVDGTQTMAVFELDGDDTDLCNYIIHFRFPEGHKMRQDRPVKSSLAWNVSDISQLKSLFKAVQHILGVLELSSSDRRELYCGEGRRTEHLSKYAEILFAHYLKIEQLSSVFDTVSALLKALNSPQCK